MFEQKKSRCCKKKVTKKNVSFPLFVSSVCVGFPGGPEKFGTERRRRQNSDAGMLPHREIFSGSETFRKMVNTI